MLKKIRARGNKWFIGGATLLMLLEVTSAGWKWI
jgi:hypothetical protein